MATAIHTPSSLLNLLNAEAVGGAGVDSAAELTAKPSSAPVPAPSVPVASFEQMEIRTRNTVTTVAALDDAEPVAEAGIQAPL
jgi:hypothetical protein